MALPEVPRARARSTARRRPSTGARSTRRCSRTSTSSTAAAGAAGTSSRRGTWRSGSSRSPTTPTSCSPTWRSSTGPRARRRSRPTGSAAPKGAEVLFRVEELDIDIPVFTTRPDTLFGATFFVVAPESPLVDAARRDDDEEVRCVRSDRRSAPDGGARAAREDGCLHRPSRDEPGERRADPDLRGRLRADGVRHGRDHGGPRTRRARRRVRTSVRPADRPGDRRRREADLLGPVQTGRTRQEAKPAIVAWLSEHGEGEAGDQLPPARLELLAAALLGRPIPVIHCPNDGIVPVPEDELPVLLPEVDDYRPKGKPPLASNAEFMNVTCPKCGGPCAARGRHDGHVRRLVLVLPALHRPAQRPRAVRPEARRLLAADRSVHRRHRPREGAPALFALLRQGDERLGHARLPRAVPAAVPPGVGAAGRQANVEVAGRRQPERADRPLRRGCGARLHPLPGARRPEHRVVARGHPRDGAVHRPPVARRARGGRRSPSRRKASTRRSRARRTRRSRASPTTSTVASFSTRRSPL